MCLFPLLQQGGRECDWSLCSSNDISAHWVYQGLKSRGLNPIDMVFAEVLPFNLSLEHRVGGGGVSARITLADGIAP